MPTSNTDSATVARLQYLYTYDAQLGEIRSRMTNRKMLPHPEDGSVVCYDPSTQTRKKMLYRNLAYTLGSGEYVPKGYKVLTLDLDNENIKFHNLKLLDQATYWDVKTALRNLLGELKITQHKNDKHAYNVEWITRRQHRVLTTYDIGKAEKIRNEKLLEFSKIVNKHIRSV